MAEVLDLASAFLVTPELVGEQRFERLREAFINNAYRPVAAIQRVGDALLLVIPAAFFVVLLLSIFDPLNITGMLVEEALGADTLKERLILFAATMAAILVPALLGLLLKGLAGLLSKLLSVPIAIARRTSMSRMMLLAGFGLLSSPE